jgi:hypothetical protein
MYTQMVADLYLRIATRKKKISLITLPDGSEKELAGWKGTTQSGDVKLSIKISDKYIKPESNDSPQNKSSEDIF